MCKCGSTLYFYKQIGPHIGEYCQKCGKWIRWVPKSEVKNGAIEEKVTETVSFITDCITEEELPWN